jgi:hypothetical protein
MFLPFSAETLAGDVQLSGPGEVLPTSTQQRMFAEWARMVVQEASTNGSGDPALTSLNWRREGGEDEYCDVLTIDIAGKASASSCRSGVLQELGWARLTTIQLENLYEWIDAIGSYEYEITQLLDGGSVKTRMDFHGRGEMQALEVDQREMDVFASDLFMQLSQPQDPVEIGAARQALEAYLDALQRGSYGEVAEMYGGELEGLQELNPGISADDHAALFQAACTQNGFVCDLSILNEVSAVKITPTKFRFVVELQSLDGMQFILGSCCGGDLSGETMVTQFEFYVEKVDGGYLVLSLPIYSA